MLACTLQDWGANLGGAKNVQFYLAAILNLNLDLVSRK
jgi:hypothetical protein